MLTLLRNNPLAALALVLVVILLALALPHAGGPDAATTLMLVLGGGIAVFGMTWRDSDTVLAYLVDIGFLDAAGGHKYRDVIIKTGDYTIVTGTDPSGSLFTNRGASAEVIFTLPAPSQAIKGAYYDFAAVVAAQNLKVKTATVDTLIAFNDLTADSVAIQTSSEIIGGLMRLICDGTSWIAVGISNGTTITVGT